MYCAIEYQPLYLPQPLGSLAFPPYTGLLLDVRITNALFVPLKLTFFIRNTGARIAYYRLINKAAYCI